MRIAAIALFKFVVQSLGFFERVGASVRPAKPTTFELRKLLNCALTIFWVIHFSKKFSLSIFLTERSTGHVSRMDAVGNGLLRFG